MFINPRLFGRYDIRRCRKWSKQGRPVLSSDFLIDRPSCLGVAALVPISFYPSRSTNERSNDLDPSSRPIHLLLHRTSPLIRSEWPPPSYPYSFVRCGGCRPSSLAYHFTSISDPHPRPACYRPISFIPPGGTKRDGKADAKQANRRLHT